MNITFSAHCEENFILTLLTGKKKNRFEKIHKLKN